MQTHVEALSVFTGTRTISVNLISPDLFCSRKSRDSWVEKSLRIINKMTFLVLHNAWVSSIRQNALCQANNATEANTAAVGRWTWKVIAIRCSAQFHHSIVALYFCSTMYLYSPEIPHLVTLIQIQIQHGLRCRNWASK